MNTINCPNCHHHIHSHTITGCTACNIHHRTLSTKDSRYTNVPCHLSPAGIANALIETERRIATASAAYHQVVLNERDLAWAQIRHLKANR